MTLKINEKFKNFLPALTPEEAAQLEESITKNGCESPLMTWNNQIIDGHNRFNIYTKTDIPFAVVDRTDDFETEDDVIEWILTNQLGRRNLSHSQKTLYIGELYEVRKKRVGEHKGNQYTEKRKSDTVTEFQSQESIRHHVELIPNEEIKPEIEQKIEYDEGYKPKPPPTKKETETAKTVAKDFNVSPRTVERAAKVHQVIKEKPELKEDFLAGKITQKEVIEKAKETTAALPKIDELKDEFTEIAARAGRKIHALLTDLQEAIIAANNEFARHGQNFDNFGNLRKTDLSKMVLDARLLKTLSKCAKCKGDKCEKCNQTGYQNKSAFSTTKSAMSE